MIEFFLKMFDIIFVILMTVMMIYFIYNIYHHLTKPSKYILAAQELGFIGYNNINGENIGMEEQQEALLKLFHLAGYFNLISLWHDLNSIGKIDNPQKVFNHLSTVVKRSNGDQSDPNKFNAKFLRENLFKTDSIDFQDVLDLILYISQHAFSRQIGQERYELISNDWINIYSEVYFHEIRKLGLIDRKYPLLNEYDSCWIAGASRIALLQRIMDFNYQVVSRHVKINGDILILAGERELSAKFDGISPLIKEKLFETLFNNTNDIDTIHLPSSNDNDAARIDEGKTYMIGLAQFYNIKLNLSEPFIEYKNKDNCPVDRSPNRIYANYETDERFKLTETRMAQDLLRTFSNPFSNQINVIDTLSTEQIRPTTASTARDATERLVKRILNGEYGDKKDFVILFCTNNPYIERQTLITQQQVNQVLENFQLHKKNYQIKIQGFGCSSKQHLTVVHSELAALIAEKWMFTMKHNQKQIKRDIKDLLFQIRNNNITIPHLPNIKTDM